MRRAIYSVLRTLLLLWTLGMAAIIAASLWLDIPGFGTSTLSPANDRVARISMAVIHGIVWAIGFGVLGVTALFARPR
jgi:hypothetical protein